MRVVHLWRAPSAKAGGGGLSMARLHHHLRRAGVDSRILCDEPQDDDPYVRKITRWQALEHGLRHITHAAGLNDIHRLSSFTVPHDPWIRSADIVHFHGLHSGFYNYLALPLLSKQTPVVLTVRDMWPMTGHCALNYDCNRWLTGCGKCPYLEAHPKVERDATAIEWKLKQGVYKRSNLTVVAVSHRYAQRARQGLLSSFPVHTIWNGVDIEVFRPLDSAAARDVLGLPDDRYVFLTTATNLERLEKGADLLIAALGRLPDSIRERSMLAIVGNSGERLSELCPIPTRTLGFVSDKDELAQVYAAADLTLIPSRSEPLSNVAVESIACGRPVVAFGVGGLPDVVRPGRTGQLAIPEDPLDFANSIAYLIRQDPSLLRMRDTCREVAVSDFSTAIETRRYLDLYRRVLVGEETVPR